MPTAEFLQNKFTEKPPIELFGYRDNFFTELDQLMNQIEQEEEDINPDDGDEISAKLLRTGPCPNSSRVYFKLTASSGHASSSETMTEFLGESLTSTITRQQLGDSFEDWIDEANEAVNEWLETGSLSTFEDLDIPQPIVDFYLSRIDTIQELADEIGIPLDELQMEIQKDYSRQFFHPANPDGIWPLTEVSGHLGGVLESKVSKLPEPVDKHILTGYASYLEDTLELPLDTGVFIYTDRGEENLELDSFHINDNYRSEIRKNLERFSTLVQISKEEGQWQEGGSISERLIRPPEPEYVNMCDNCLYREECHDI